MLRTSLPLLVAAAALSSIIGPTCWPTVARAASCPAVTASLNVPLGGQLNDILIDDACQHVYVTNASTNHVDVYSLQTGKLDTPIQVGSLPAGLDLSPDGATLYVANSGGNNFSVVDTSQGTETRKVAVAAGFSNDKPFSIAVARSGLVLFSTTFAGSGFGGRVLQFDPTTDEVTQRTDFWIRGTTTESTFLKASGDRSAIGIVAGDISSGPVFRYASAANTFSKEKDLNAFVSYVALDDAGSTILVDPGTSVLDATLSLAGTIPGGSFGVAVDPSGTVGYRVSTAQVDVLDLGGFTTTTSLDLDDTVETADAFGFGVGRIAISRDGTLLAVITDHGVSIVPTRRAGDLKASRACRKEIAKRAAGLVNVALSIIDGCHRARDAGKLQDGCNDLAQAHTKGRYAQAIVTARGALAKKCREDDPVRDGYANGDPGAALVAAIPAALDVAAADLLGTPALVGDKTRTGCHAAIANAMAADIRETVQLGVACQSALDKQAAAFGTVATDCVVAPDKAGPKGDQAIAKKCTEKGFGGAEVGSCDALPGCVRDAATTTGQGLLQRIYGGP